MKRLISLVLVLALIFSIFAIPVQASALTGLLIGVPALSVVAAALIGLGISPGSDGSVFDGLVGDAVAHLQSLGFGDGITIPVLKYMGTGGGIQYALQSVAMAALRSWLFDEEVVTSSVPVVTRTLLSDGTSSSIPIYADFSYTLVHFSGYYDSMYRNFCTDYFVLYTESPSSTSFHAGSISYSLTSIDGTRYYSVFSSQSAWDTTGPLFSSNIPFVQVTGVWNDTQLSNFIKNFDYTSVSSSISTTYDLSLGDVASEDTSLSTAYPDWAIDSVQTDPDPDDPDDEPDLFIPVTLLPTYEDTKSQTQDDAQSGNSTLETDNSGTSVDISGDVGGSLTPDDGDDGSGDLPSGSDGVTVSDLTTMFAWLASSIDQSIELLFPDLQVIKTYLKTLAQWHENENVKYDSMLSYFAGWDTDIDTMMTSLSNIDVNVASQVSILGGMASDLKDIRDVIADPLDADINKSQTDNKTAFLNNFGSKSQSENIGQLAGLSGGMTDWFKLPDVDITSMFDQVESGYGQWFTSATAQSIAVGGGAAAVAAAAGVDLMEDQEYVPPETPYLDAWDQEVQDILAGGDGEW